jgi:ABC-type glycerol-3-phosphate transport system substrate-binding protein
MSKFQIILISVFVLSIIAGVIAFASFKGSGGVAELPAITIWGTFPGDIFSQYITKINMNRSQSLKIAYTEILETDFDKVFVEALARGNGPDAILIPQDLIHKHEDKVVLIPYTVLTQRDFKNAFIKQAELYLGNEGSMALPFIVDPIVMYWNRDSFSNAGIATFPKFWDEFNDLNKKLTVKDVNSNLRKSAIAMGEFNNILHAREILGTLFLQSGNPVTYRDSDTNIASALGSRTFVGLPTSVPALDFFNQFSNSSNPNYSWNRSLPDSRSWFLTGNLATYFGFASELVDIRNKNPNLDFDIAPIPQARGAKNRATYGSMYGFSMVKSTTNANNTFTVINSLLEPKAIAEMISLSYLPPVRRDMIGAGSTDPYLSIFYDSALISKGWLDTNKKESNRLFQSIVESVTSGKQNSSDALQNGSDEFDISLKNI